MAVVVAVVAAVRLVWVVLGVVMTKAMTVSASGPAIAVTGLSITFTFAIDFTIASLRGVTEIRCYQVLISCHMLPWNLL